MLNVALILTALAIASYLAYSSRLRKSATWNAMLTPLASIMGSGFLVSAPLLASEVGNLAVVCMAVLLILAFGLGSVVRFNIQHFEPIERTGNGPAQTVAHLSRLVLAGAYFISITYYLQLLAAFALNMAGYESATVASWITTALLVLIGGLGMWRGLSMFERVETYAISLNLGVIGALLLALFLHNGSALLRGEWALADIPTGIDGHGLRVLLGLLIVVQGFETSRYLGEEHSAEVRVRTMRLAQIVSSCIYLVFLASATILFRGDLGADVTAIIAMVAPLALVLPFMIALAAIGSQFSAAVADTSGAGGLVEDLTDGKLPARAVYALILVITVAITWETDVNEIISFASRAFALYYMMQCLVAANVLRTTSELKSTGRWVLFMSLGGLCLAVFLLGLPAEG